MLESPRSPSLARSCSGPAVGIRGIFRLRDKLDHTNGQEATGTTPGLLSNPSGHPVEVPRAPWPFVVLQTSSGPPGVALQGHLLCHGLEAVARARARRGSSDLRSDGQQVLRLVAAESVHVHGGTEHAGVLVGRLHPGVRRHREEPRSPLQERPPGRALALLLLDAEVVECLVVIETSDVTERDANIPSLAGPILASEQQSLHHQPCRVVVERRLIRAHAGRVGDGGLLEDDVVDDEPWDAAQLTRDELAAIEGLDVIFPVEGLGLLDPEAGFDPDDGR